MKPAPIKKAMAVSKSKASASPGQAKKIAGAQSAKAYTKPALGVDRATAGPTGNKPPQHRNARTVAFNAAVKRQNPVLPKAAPAPQANPVAGVLRAVGSFFQSRNDLATGKTASPISRATTTYGRVNKIISGKK